MSALPAELLRRHRVSVAEYYRMAEVGLLPPEARVELIEGEIVDMVPIGNRHAVTVTNLTMALAQAVGSRARVSVQNPLRLSERSEPQPDLVVLRNPMADWPASCAGVNRISAGDFRRLGAMELTRQTKGWAIRAAQPLRGHRFWSVRSDADSDQ